MNLQGWLLAFAIGAVGLALFLILMPSTDPTPVEARYVLTPLLMDRLVELRARTETPPHLACFGNHVHVAFHYGRSLFEPSYFFTESFETVRRMAEDVGLAELLVRELDLNTRIWAKR